MTFTGAGVVCLVIAMAAVLLGRGVRDAHTHDRHSGPIPNSE